MDDETRRELNELRRFSLKLLATLNAMETMLVKVIDSSPNREAMYGILPELLAQFDATSLNQPIPDEQLAVMRATFERMLTPPKRMG